VRNALAAFAALAAANMNRRSAGILMGSVWLLNQIVGFTCLGYPRTATTFIWSIALAAASFLALFAAQQVVRNMKTTNYAVGTAAAFIVAFSVLELSMFTVSFFMPGGESDFVWSVFVRIFASNVVALVALSLAHRAATRVELISRFRIEEPMLTRLA
jgi:hypothetical protein